MLIDYQLLLVRYRIITPRFICLIRYHIFASLLITASGINTNLQTISASGHDLPPESLKRLGLALSTQAKLLSSQSVNGGILGITSIAIGSNKMSDVGVIAFCQGLDESNGGLLRVVDFGWKNL